MIATNKNLIAKRQPTSDQILTPKKVLKFLKKEVSCIKHIQPLALDIHKELKEVYPVFNENAGLLSVALALHVNAKKYLKHVQYAKNRVHLDGSLGEAITIQERLYSRNKRIKLYPKAAAAGETEGNWCFVISDLDQKSGLIRTAVVSSACAASAIEYARLFKSGVMLPSIVTLDNDEEDRRYFIDECFPNTSMIIDRVYQCSEGVKEGVISYNHKQLLAEF